MGAVRIGKHHAVFEPAYTGREMPYRAVFWPGMLSRHLRAFFFGLPHSRLRMAFVGAFFFRMMDEISTGNIRKIVRAIDPEAENELFTLGTFTGPEGWARGFDEWVHTFEGFSLNVRELVNPPGDRVLLVMGASGSPGEGTSPLTATFFFVLTVRGGMAVAGKIYDEKAAALEAAGLSE